MKKYSELYAPNLNDLKTKKENSFIYVNNQGKISVAENLLLNPNNLVLEKNNNSYNFSKPTPATADILIVAGGGSSIATSAQNQSYGGGGGGAGGYLEQIRNLEGIDGTYSIVVGSGGQSIDDTTTGQNNGQKSEAFGLTANGGGRGGYRPSNLSSYHGSAYVNGQPGGSGGGATLYLHNGTRWGAGIGTGTPGQGNNGGAGTGTTSSGGGGKNGVGATHPTGTGGAGKQWHDGNIYAKGGNAAVFSTSVSAGTNTGNGGSNSSGASGIVAIRYPKESNLSYTFSGTSTLDTSSSTTYNFLYMTSSGDLTLTYTSPSHLNLKNANMNITSESEFENIRTEKIYDQGNSYTLKGRITETASGKPHFDARGSVKLIKDSTNNNLKISHLNKSIFSPDAEEHAWKSWSDRHESSYTQLQNLIGKIGNLNYETYTAATTSEKNTLIETDLTNSAIYSLGSPGNNTFIDLTWHSVLNGYLADTFSNFVGDGSTNLGSHLGINTPDLTRFKRKNIYFFVQFTGLSKMIVTLPNPINSDGELIYSKGSVISVFLRKHANNPANVSKNNRFVDFYVSNGTKLSLSDLTSLGYGYYHYPYYYSLPNSENIEISIPNKTLYEGWFKFDFICMRSDNNNLQETWKFIKTGFV